jgi:hypothetical protein
MLFLFWALMFLTAACVILFMPALWGKHIYDAYRGARTVTCPETHSPVKVRFKAFRAAFTSLNGKPKLSLASCSNWPARATCDQACIPDAERAVPQSRAVFRPIENRVAHLPVLIAAGAAWVLGVIWHSEYVFRSLWAHAAGLTDQQAHDLARTWTPHLLTVAGCLFFSYFVGGLLAWLGKRCISAGLQVSSALWLLTTGILLLVIRWNFGPNLLWIEGGYSLLASLSVGSLVGGLPRQVFLKDSEKDTRSPIAA